jgi:cell division protein FtsW
MGLQPSEFAKVAFCVWVAAYCERNFGRMRHVVYGFIIPLSIVGAGALLILCEPDFGTAALVAGVCLLVLMVFGTRMIFVLAGTAAFMPLLKKLLLDVPYRRARILAFLNPQYDPDGAGYQLIQSKIAIGSGRIFGRGLGLGQQKAGFLPNPDNDFIFSIIGEELGFIGGAILIAAFLLLLHESMKVALRSRDRFAFGLSLGLGLLLTTQAAAHIAVVTGSVPTKGLSLPFVSAGGSSLLASLLAAGILVNIAHSQEETSRPPLPHWAEDMPGYERFAYVFLRVLGRAALGCARGLARHQHGTGRE